MPPVPSPQHPVADPRWMVWTGRVIGGLPALFLLLGGVMNLFKPAFVVQGTVEMGYSEQIIVPLGAVLATCAVLYLIPQTAVLGAVLLTGYLGGAVATHVRAGHGAFEMLFPVAFGLLLWGGLVLRDRRLRALLPWRTLGSPYTFARTPDSPIPRDATTGSTRPRPETVR